jgi:LmbE family N-acetylglucosaminyl deacetylase
MEFVDFGTGSRGGDIGLFFPGWKKGETVAFLSPHDDDVVLGAGHLVRAVIKNGGRPVVLVFCRGDAGYSTAVEKRTIVARRRREAVAAYGLLGVPPNDVHFFGLPDLSLMAHVDRIMPGGSRGVVEELIRLLRSRGAGRVVFSSPHFENWDHTAVHRLGMYVAPQAGDPILADLGVPVPVLSLLVYSVWGDFAPGSPEGLSADLGLLADDKEEKAVRKARAAFGSQAAVIENTAAGRRDARRGPDGWLELFRRAAVREPVDYARYFRKLKGS